MTSDQLLIFLLGMISGGALMLASLHLALRNQPQYCQCGHLRCMHHHRAEGAFICNELVSKPEFPGALFTCSCAEFVLVHGASAPREAAVEELNRLAKLEDRRP